MVVRFGRASCNFCSSCFIPFLLWVSSTYDLILRLFVSYVFFTYLSYPATIACVLLVSGIVCLLCSLFFFSFFLFLFLSRSLSLSSPSSASAWEWDWISQKQTPTNMDQNGFGVICCFNLYWHRCSGVKFWCLVIVLFNCS